LKVVEKNSSAQMIQRKLLVAGVDLEFMECRSFIETIQRFKP